MRAIVVSHPNGYTGILYPNRSFMITNKNGYMVLHTCSPNINTGEEVLEVLNRIPDLIKVLPDIIADNDEEHNI